jgi:hypothetical protein
VTDENVERYAQLVVESYSKLRTKKLPYRPIAVCSFVLFETAGKRFQDTIADVCHSQLCPCRETRLPYDCLITSYPIKDNVLDTNYFNFLIAHPYKQWANSITLCRTKDDKPYIRVNNLSEIPANVLYNFCIATRLIVEFRDELETWRHFIGIGCHPVFAFALALLVDEKVTLDDVVASLASDENHKPIDKSLSLTTLFGNPSNLSKSYTVASDSCTPTNIIWGKDKDFRSLVGKSIREFASQWQKDHPKHENLLLTP